MVEILKHIARSQIDQRVVAIRKYLTFTKYKCKRAYKIGQLYAAAVYTVYV
jgi:hypothetical protein